jgi:hypothetical protein
VLFFWGGSDVSTAGAAAVVRCGSVPITVQTSGSATGGCILDRFQPTQSPTDRPTANTAGNTPLLPPPQAALNVDPLYSAAFYSHPPLVERLAAIDAALRGQGKKD